MAFGVKLRTVHRFNENIPYLLSTKTSVTMFTFNGLKCVLVLSSQYRKLEKVQTD